MVHSVREPFPGPLAGARGLVGASRGIQLVCVLVSKLACRSGELFLKGEELLPRE